MKALTRTTRAGLAVAAAVALLAAGCGGDGEDADGSNGNADGGGGGGEGAGDGHPLAQACPETVVIQTNWWPQAEYGGLYHVLGPDPDIDADAKTISGALMDDGTDTGTRLELRSGGPANSYVPAISVLYSDDSVHLGGADLDQVVQFSAEQPVRAVFAPMASSPLLIMWDPQAHPEFETIADIGGTDTTVLYFSGSTYMEYLVGTGVLQADQVDPSYEGAPARFVAEEGAIAQQGFLTNEVYQYEHELPEWGRPVAYQLVADAGYPMYAEALTVRADQVDELAPCLSELVPILQRGTAAYAADPDRTNELLVTLVDDFGAFPYSAERAAAAVESMLAEGVLGNGENDTLGDFDADRVEEILEITTSLFVDQHVVVADGLSADDLYTNEFIDTAIGLD